jgi:tetratricopeptide (TPR) repeat protein/transcriptional regulator with XRE-family HTH domain
MNVERGDGLAVAVFTQRMKASLTQEELAAHAGLSTRTIRNVEAGITRPQPHTIRQLAQALQIDLHDLTMVSDESVDDAQSSRPRSDEASAPLLTPAQLPTDLRAFAGRDEELTQLETFVTGSVVTITGTAGVGKTALAVHWAHQIAERFPDGQLYVNLRGFDRNDRILAPGDVLRGFLSALGIADQRIPSDFESQIGLYRSALAGRRLLVVLDNARASAQVEALLPGSGGCLTIITSRHDLAGVVVATGAHALVLQCPSQNEARQMLVGRLGPDRVGADPGAVDEIIDRCARLPLALAVVAASAASHPDFDLARVATELRAAGGRLDAFDAGDELADVRAAFSWSYRALTNDGARLYRRLGVHAGPHISVTAAASLADIGVAEAQRSLAELARAHLVAVDAEGRYALHDLLHAYAVELATSVDAPQARARARERVLDHYLHSAFAAARLLDPHRDPIVLDPPVTGTHVVQFGDRHAAMAWFDIEHQVMLAAIRDTSTRTVAARHTWQLAWTLRAFLQRRGRLIAWLDTQTAALAASRILRDAPGQIRALCDISRALVLMGRPDEAADEAERARDLAAKLGDHLGEGHAEHELTWAVAQQGDHVAALTHAKRAMVLYQSAAADLRARALNGLGYCYHLLGDGEQALQACERAGELFREIDDRHSEAFSWTGIGRAHHKLGRFALAARSFQRAIALFADNGDHHGQVENLRWLGDARHAAGNQIGAKRAWRRALAMLTEFDWLDAEPLQARLRTVADARDPYKAPNHQARSISAVGC